VHARTVDIPAAVERTVGRHDMIFSVPQKRRVYCIRPCPFPCHCTRPCTRSGCSSMNSLSSSGTRDLVHHVAVACWMYFAALLVPMGPTALRGVCGCVGVGRAWEDGWCLRCTKHKHMAYTWHTSQTCIPAYTHSPSAGLIGLRNTHRADRPCVEENGGGNLSQPTT